MKTYKLIRPEAILAILWICYTNLLGGVRGPLPWRAETLTVGVKALPPFVPTLSFQSFYVHS